MSLVLDESHPVDSRRALIGFDLIPCLDQRGFPIDFVDQAEPLASFDALIERLEHSLGPDGWFHPRPFGRGFFSLFSPFGHCRRFVFHPLCPHCDFHFPALLRSASFQRFHRYYECSDFRRPLMPAAGSPCFTLHNLLEPFCLQPPCTPFHHHLSPGVEGLPRTVCSYFVP